MAFDEKNKFDSEQEGKEKKENKEKQSSDKESSEYVPVGNDAEAEEKKDIEMETTNKLADLKIDIQTGAEEGEILTENIETSRGGDKIVGYSRKDKGFAYRPQNIRQSEVREDMDPDAGRMASVNAVTDLRSEVRNKRFGLG